MIIKQVGFPAKLSLPGGGGRAGVGEDISRSLDLNFLREIEFKDLNLGVICIDVAPVRKDANFWEKV